jgi:hypothetical protein
MQTESLPNCYLVGVTTVSMDMKRDQETQNLLTEESVTPYVFR